MKKPKRAKETMNLCMVAGIVDGQRRRCFVSADEMTDARLKAKGIQLGEVIGAQLLKDRDPKNWRRAHKLAQLLIENTDDFALYTDAHKVIKRLQLETGIGCEETAIRLDGYGMVMHRQALSLAFDAMEEPDFQEIYDGFAAHIIKKYWPDLDLAAIEDMAGLVGRAA